MMRRMRRSSRKRRMLQRRRERQRAEQRQGGKGLPGPVRLEVVLLLVDQKLRLFFLLHFFANLPVKNENVGLNQIKGFQSN